MNEKNTFYMDEELELFHLSAFYSQFPDQLCPSEHICSSPGCFSLCYSIRFLKCGSVSGH